MSVAAMTWALTAGWAARSMFQSLFEKNVVGVIGWFLWFLTCMYFSASGMAGL